ncbi:P-loop NTPase fold protein [Microcoleus sp. S13_B4]|uniref:P-loop NTPase fold protein n=1 Tax=Microcoleus sp. S13_B4 TaxID=3055408 RepID=UPI002FD2204A
MQLLSDNPSPSDILGFDGMDNIIYNVIRDMPEPPFTIGIFGEWGCGKTTLMRMVQNRLNNDNVKTVWFNAWKYDGKEVIWNALIQQIFYTMKEDPEVKSRQNSEELLNQIGDVSIELAKYAAKVFTRFVPGGIVKEEDVNTLVKAFTPLCAVDPQFDFINKFEYKFNELVKKYVGGEDKHLIVFIDDLDRCLPENAITVMEALKLYLDRANCIFVIGTESSIIEEGIRHRYKDNQRLSGKEYLEKIIQLPFVMRGIDTDNALSLLDPYEKTLGYHNDPIIRTLLVEGTKCNPRRIKRFINAFWVLSAIANYPDAVNTLSQGKRHNLAKILLIQMRFPKLYYALVDELEIVADLTHICQLDASERDSALALKSITFRGFYEDKEIKAFLIKTSQIPCLPSSIKEWVLLTKGQPIIAE